MKHNTIYIRGLEFLLLHYYIMGNRDMEDRCWEIEEWTSFEMHWAFDAFEETKEDF